MSNPEHLAKLLEGSGAWNCWRADNPDVIPDLSDAVLSEHAGLPRQILVGRLNLRGVVLTRADLSTVNLTYVDLADACLVDAALRDSDLSRATLIGADLSGANLAGALFNGAELSGAKLTGARLDGANLRLATGLTEAQLKAAHCDETTLLPPYLDAQGIGGKSRTQSEGGKADDTLSSDPFTVLQIPPDSNLERIRAAYYRLAAIYNPEASRGDAKAERHFRRINEAYRLAVAIKGLRDSGPKRRGTVLRKLAASLFICLLAGVTAMSIFDLGKPVSEEGMQQTAEIGIDEAPQQTAATATDEEPQKTAEGQGEEALQQTASAASEERPHHVALVEIGPDPDEQDKLSADQKLTTGSTKSAPGSGQGTPAASQLPIRLTQNFSMQLDMVDYFQVPRAASDPAPADPQVVAEKAGPKPDEPANDPAPDRLVQQDSAETPSPPNPDAGKRSQTEIAQNGGSGPWVFDVPPWQLEWEALRGTRDLVALQDFISRYPNTDQADMARQNFRIGLAGIVQVEELEQLALKLPSDSPERLLVNRRIASLNEQLIWQGDPGLWQKPAATANIAGIEVMLGRYLSVPILERAKRDAVASPAEVSQGEAEDAAWESAQEDGSRAALNDFLRTYPEGRHAQAAKDLLDGIDSELAAASEEDDAWQWATKRNTRNGYLHYLSAYPNGRYATSAMQALRSLVAGSDYVPQIRSVKDGGSFGPYIGSLKDRTVYSHAPQSILIAQPPRSEHMPRSSRWQYYRFPFGETSSHTVY